MASKAALDLVIGLRDEASRGLDTLQGKISTLGKVALGVGAAGIAAVGAAMVPAVGMAGDFEAGLNMLQAVSGATTEQMAILAQRAIDLGNDLSLPSTSAANAGAAMTELAKAGLAVDDVLGAAKGTLQLAAAGALSEAQAAEIAANALNSFGLEGSEATRVANLLAAAANASSADVTDVADSLKMSSAVFAAAGVPIQDLTAMITEMANQGIKGSDAGTSLKTMLLALQAPTDKAAGLLEELGIKVYDSRGQMKPMREIIGQFTDKLKGASDEERNFALKTIFGTDAIRAANIVMMGGVQAFDDMSKAVTREGAAADLAGARSKGFNGVIEGLKSQLETIALKIGMAVLPALTDLMRVVSEGIGPAWAWLEQNGQNLVPILLAIATAITGFLVPAFVVWGQGALAAATATMTALAPVAVPVLAIAAAVGLLYAAWQNNWGGIRDTLTAIWETNLRPVFESVREWLGVAIPAAVAVAAGFWEKTLRPALESVWAFIQANVIPILQTAAKWLQENIPIAIQKAADFWETTLKPALNTVWKFISVNLQPVIEKIVSWLETNIPAAIALAEKAWKVVLKPAMELVYDLVDQKLLPVIKSIVSWLETNIPTAIATAKKVFDEFKTKAGELWDELEPVRKVISDIAAWIGEKLEPAITGFKTFIAGVHFSNPFGDLLGWISGVIDKVGTAIQAVRDLLGLTGGSGGGGPKKTGAAGSGGGGPTFTGGGSTSPLAAGAAVGGGVTNNYNLTIHTAAKTEPVAADFAMLRALGGA